MLDGESGDVDYTKAALLASAAHHELEGAISQFKAYTIRGQNDRAEYFRNRAKDILDSILDLETSRIYGCIRAHLNRDSE